MEYDSIGIPFWEYSSMILFKDQEKFQLILKANPHMEAIVGGDSETQRNFPGVYLAGIRANSHGDKTAAHHTAIQK